MIDEWLKSVELDKLYCGPMTHALTCMSDSIVRDHNGTSALDANVLVSV